jgi:hypothetical protein
MAQRPIRSINDVPGLIDALATKADAGRFIGFQRLIVSDSPPSDPQEGDVWFQYQVNRAPLPFIPTVSDISSTGCIVTAMTTDPDGDVITYKYQILPAAADVPPSDDVSWNTATSFTSPQVVSGLSPNTSYRVHVLATDGIFGTVGSSMSFDTLSTIVSDWWFDEPAGTPPDPAVFTVSVDGSNTIATDGAGNLRINKVAASATQDCNMSLPNMVRGVATSVFKNKFSLSSSGLGTSAGFYPCVCGEPYVASILNASINLSNRRFAVAAQTSSSAWVYYRGDGSLTTSTNSDTVGFYYTISLDTYYVFRADLTVSTIRYRLLSEDETTTYFDTGAIDLSLLKSTTNLRFSVSTDNASGCYGAMLIDFIHFGAS